MTKRPLGVSAADAAATTVLTTDAGSLAVDKGVFTIKPRTGRASGKPGRSPYETCSGRYSFDG